jgi:putative cell wall binding repeat protein
MRPLLSDPMRAAPLPRLLAAGLLLAVLAAVLAGCGKSGRPETGPEGTIPPVGAASAVGVATANTTRLGGDDPVSDAAAVARAVYPGLTTTTRPQAVVLVNKGDWAASLAASALASAPLNAPLLYSEGDTLPGASLDALQAMRPTGATALGGAQVIRIGTQAAVPEGLRTRDVSTAGGPAEVAVAVQRLLGLARGNSRGPVIALSAEAPLALQMPAAGLSAESGAPILMLAADSVPTATATALESLHHPAIYIVNPADVGKQALSALARLGHVTPILDSSTPVAPATPTAPTAPSGPIANAIAVSRFTDGTFGWGVKEPGHGLAFLNAGRPFDAPASALLSATGDYAPPLLLEGSVGVPTALAGYLSDIQPAYGTAPQYQAVHGTYNHGWLIGNERAISLRTQAEIDSMLAITPRHLSAEEEPSAATTE